TENENRKLLFERKEMIGHIRTLYANWASLSLFPSGQDDSGVTDAVTQFEILIREAREAPTFDSLIASDFFNRIRLFKESASEMFFAADVVAAAIDCNVRIGNRFVDLIQAERESDEAEKKYGYSYDTIVSNAASKTLLLVDLLKDEAVPVEELESDLDEIEPEPISTASYDRAPVKEVISFSPRSVNWWLIGTMIVVLIISAGIYLWSENAVESSGAVEKAASIDLSTSDLNTHIRQASSSSETLYGIINPSWDALSDDEKKDFLKKSLQFANAVKLKRVNLMNNKGRTVGFASADRLEILNP
ncbi:MAG TPA: hypothetical protein VK612_00370, partial [Pyrinomonadaceae bacterium]|nr:hypothetical protein [Pyrinomonadaceae bacterium]